MENLQPSIHRKWIKEGKMTEEESNQIVREWEIKNKIERDTGELIEDMGLEEEEEEAFDKMIEGKIEEDKIEELEKREKEKLEEH